MLQGDFIVLLQVCGLVIFVYGSGSSWFSLCSWVVVGVLYQYGLVMLLFDLFSISEDVDWCMCFDIVLFVLWLGQVVIWVVGMLSLCVLLVGLFGVSMGVVVVLVVVVQQFEWIVVVVLCGGCFDLVGIVVLVKIIVLMLLIVGGVDIDVIMFNCQVLVLMQENVELVLVLCVIYLFEEFGVLECVVVLVVDWFMCWFGV